MHGCKYCAAASSGQHPRPRLAEEVEGLLDPVVLRRRLRSVVVRKRLEPLLELFEGDGPLALHVRPHDSPARRDEEGASQEQGVGAHTVEVALHAFGPNALDALADVGEPLPAEQSPEAALAERLVKKPVLVDVELAAGVILEEGLSLAAAILVETGFLQHCDQPQLRQPRVSCEEVRKGVGLLAAQPSARPAHGEHQGARAFPGSPRRHGLAQAEGLAVDWAQPHICYAHGQVELVRHARQPVGIPSVAKLGKHGGDLLKWVNLHVLLLPGQNRILEVVVADPGLTVHTVLGLRNLRSLRSLRDLRSCRLRSKAGRRRLGLGLALVEGLLQAAEGVLLLRRPPADAGTAPLRLGGGDEGLPRHVPGNLPP
mmetsp:Transcript_67484/g.176963  ORF Transcript_67484/g.176963 Transcript_67484/m.176963 type:complete len:371 (-) Transcript_67484:158-1270(-)